MRPGWWRRNRGLLILPILALVIVFAILRLSPPRTIVVNWDYDYAHDPPCSSRVADNCVTGFRVFLGEPGNRFQQLFVPNPVDAGREPRKSRFGATFKVRRFGYLQFCVLAVKEGPSASTTVESAPICMKRLVLPFGIGSYWAQ